MALPLLNTAKNRTVPAEERSRKCLSNESALPAVLPLCVYLLLIFAQDSEEEDVETFVVSLAKNSQGLGITIAGYVGDKNSGEDWNNEESASAKKQHQCQLPNIEC